MNIILNNRPTSIDAETISISELIKLQKFSFKMLIIKLNGTLIKKENQSETLVKEGDNLEVIHLMSGG